MTPEEVKAIITLSGVVCNDLTTTRNPYWPMHPDYDEMREKYPWYCIHTTEGVITIGWRKRVIAIDWSMTTRRGLVTKDDVTKDDALVHAWSTAKAVEYLRAWRSLPIQDVPTGEKHKGHLLEGREKVIEALRMLGDGSDEMDLIKNLLDEVKDESSVVAVATRVGDIGYSFNIRVGRMTIHHYPRGK